MAEPLENDGEQSLTDLAGLLAGDKDGTQGALEREPDGEKPEAETSDAEPGDPAEAGTGEAEQGEGDGEAPSGEAEEEPQAEQTFTVKVDGKDVRVTLQEALKGYQREADYTRKTSEVAERRKAAEAELAAAQNVRNQYAAVLKLVQDQLGAADQEPTAEQWNQLRQVDPAAYTTAWADYGRRQEMRRQVEAEQQRIAEENRVQSLRRAQTFLETERTKLLAALPVLADPVKAPVEMRAIRDYAAKAFGFTEQEMDAAYDHRMVLAIDKARRWDNHLAALAKARSKITSAPELPEPGPRLPPNSGKAAARAALQKRFEKTGDPDDAAALFIAGG